MIALTSVQGMTGMDSAAHLSSKAAIAVFFAGFVSTLSHGKPTADRMNDLFK
jgi:hypothetical protein